MSKRAEILSLANRELQEKGVGSLSFRELAAKLGIKSSSVHYYFPQKDDLIDALAEDYAHNVFEAVKARTEKLASGKPRLIALMDIIHENIQNRVCTAGILAVESAYVSDTTRATIGRFFENLLAWIKSELKALGKSEKETQILGPVILTSIEGSLMLDSLETQSRYLNKLRDYIASL